jgi:hypothetical protein
MAAGWESAAGGTSQKGRGWDQSSLQPPSPADVFEWWDGSDITTLYSDATAETLIGGSDEDTIKAIRSKGLAGTVLSHSDTDVVWHASYQNSLGAIRFDATAAEIGAECAAEMDGRDWTYLVVSSWDEANLTTYGMLRTAADPAPTVWGDRTSTNEQRVVTSANSKDNNAPQGDTVISAMVFTVVFAPDAEGNTGGEVYNTGGSTSNTYAQTWNEGVDDMTWKTGDDIVMHYSGQRGFIGEIIVWNGHPILADIRTYVTNKWNLSWS